MSVMRILLSVGAFCMVGCGVTQEQLNDLEARIATKIQESAADLERKINATDAKYANMLALEQKVKNGVEKIDKNAKLLQDSGQAWKQVLQTQRNVLREQLKSVDDQIAGLRP